MKLKKRWIVVGGVALLAAYASYNFSEDRALFLGMLAHTNKQGDVLKTIEMMDEHRFLTNPIINIFFQVKKSQFRSRFVDFDEKFDPISSNAKVNAVVDLYRQYWNSKLLTPTGDEDADFLRRMAKLVGGVEMGEQALAAEPDSDIVLEGMLEVIESTGLHASTFYLNSSYGLKIWENQTIEEYHIELPDESTDVEVVLIKDYLLHGYNYYSSMGVYTDGGWASVDNRVYCNSEAYDFDSEKFLVSFLKHEGLHFADMRNYPNLSGTDLEYRSKLLEIMSSTDATIYNLLESFISGASATDRTFSHAYANHYLIRNLSRILFDNEYVDDMSRWKDIPYRRLNDAAKQLYGESREQLAQDPSASEII